MLLLTRRVGESVVIDKNIFLTVISSEDGNIKLAFEAPKAVSINRLEKTPLINKLTLSKNKT